MKILPGVWHLAAGLVCVAALNASAMACTSHPRPYAPLPYHGTFLQEYLANGQCHVAVVIEREEARVAARAYASTYGRPTSSCPAPDVVVMTNIDERLTTGDLFRGQWRIIRFDADSNVPG